MGQSRAVYRTVFCRGMADDIRRRVEAYDTDDLANGLSLRAASGGPARCATESAAMSAKVIALKIPRCSRCKKPRDRNGRYCKRCHAAYMRVWRPPYHLLSEDQKKHHRARAYARSYVRRGHLKQRPCAECGDPKSQMHHPDYDKPLMVVWLCEFHHLHWHRLEPKKSELPPDQAAAIKRILKALRADREKPVKRRAA
jgi:hypothetical protein